MDLDLQGWAELRLLGRIYVDLQKTRIAVENRVKRTAVGLREEDYQLGAHVDSMAAAEKLAAEDLRATYRRVAPARLIAWQDDAYGIGELHLARLLGQTGHPRVAFPKHWEGTGSKRHLVADEPFERSLRQFWAYCGHGDPSRRKKRGASPEENFAAGDPSAKMITYLMAVQVVKLGPRSEKPTHRLVYDDARRAYADRVHATACVRCGPSGKPAPEGSPWSAAHQHAAAVRKTGKELLRDIWRNAVD